MRRSVTIAALAVITVVAGAAAYRFAKWKDYDYPGTRLMVDLGRPDAVIRTASLSKLPRDLLNVPIARDVLTEDLVFYYEQHEDRMGLNGAIKRIAYEHQLGWTEQILASALDEPAEVALWRDGKGALRHFAIVMRRNALSKVIQEAATVALKDRQLKAAGDISTSNGKAKAYALVLNPRRTMLLVAQGDRLVVLSDPGLLFDDGNDMLTDAHDAIAEWLESDGVLSKKFALDEVQPAKGVMPRHSLAVGAATLSLGYGKFMPGFKGLRLDYERSWSTSVWTDPKGLPASGMGNAALWRAAPANPGACTVLPVDWKSTEKVLSEASTKLQLSKEIMANAFDGSALACWYDESSLYSPVFIARLSDKVGVNDRRVALQSIAAWAISAVPAEEGKAKASKARNDARTDKEKALVWRKAPPNEASAGNTSATASATVALHGQYVVFSPDGALADLVIDTLSRAHPSVADQMPVSNNTLMLVTPRRLSAMGLKEVMEALSGPGDANLKAAAHTHLPSRMKALAAYPPYRLELSDSAKPAVAWQRVQWRTPEEGK